MNRSFSDTWELVGRAVGMFRDWGHLPVVQIYSDVITIKLEAERIITKLVPLEGADKFECFAKGGCLIICWWFYFDDTEDKL